MTCDVSPVAMFFLQKQGVQGFEISYGSLLVMTKTKSKTKTNTKTKTKTKCFQDPIYAFFQKQGVKGFKILYWLSSCDDKDKDKDKVLPRPNVCYFLFF